MNNKTVLHYAMSMAVTKKEVAMAMCLGLFGASVIVYKEYSDGNLFNPDEKSDKKLRAMPQVYSSFSELFYTKEMRQASMAQKTRELEELEFGQEDNLENIEKDL